MPVAAGVPIAQDTVAETSPPVAVELRLRGGRSLHFESTIDLTALSVLSKRCAGHTCLARHSKAAGR